MTNESGPVCRPYRAIPCATSRTVPWMLAVPPLIVLFGVLLSGGQGARSRSGETVWQCSPAQMEARARAIRSVIRPGAASTRVHVVVEPAEGYSTDGSCRGMWKANVFDQKGVFLFTATWEDATGELIQLSRSLNDYAPDTSPEAALRSSAEAAESARTWMGKLSSVNRRAWKVESTKSQGGCWRVYLTSPEGRMLVQMDTKTGTPAYLAFRPSTYPSLRGIE